MEVDIDTLKNELDFLNDEIEECNDLETLEKLVYSFTFLNSLYISITNKPLPRKICKNISNARLDRYTMKRLNNSALRLVSRFEKEKEFLEPYITKYVDYLQQCDEEIDLSIEHQKEFSKEDFINIILSFFSEFGDKVLHIAQTIIYNNQIYTGYKYLSPSDIEDEFQQLLVAYSKLDEKKYTTRSITLFKLIYCSIIQELTSSDKPVDDAKFLEYIETLEKMYNELELVDKNDHKDEIVLENRTVLLAFTIISSVLNKSYIITKNTALTVNLMIDIVHEIGHAIEGEFIVFPFDRNLHLDSGYYSEVSSCYFEYEFIKYLRDLGIEPNEVQNKLYNYYLDIGDSFLDLERIADSSLIKFDSESCQYRTELGKIFETDTSYLVKYGLGRYIAQTISNAYPDKSEALNVLYQFMKDRESLSTEELLNNANLTLDYKNENELLSLIRKFNK